MTDGTNATYDESTPGDDLRTQVQAVGEQLKTEVATRIDQALDELGTLIGSS